MKYRHLLTVAFCTLALLAMAMPSAAQIELRFDPPDTSVAVGDSFRLSIVLDEAQDVRSFEVWLRYDPDILTFVGGEPGLAFVESGCQLFEGAEEDTLGTLHGYVVIMGAECWVTGPGELFAWEFTGSALGLVQIVVNDVALYAPQIGEIGNVSLENAAVEVVARYPVTIFVATTGSDATGDGSEGNPYATIQHAIDLSLDGDEVCVQPGTYTGPGNRDIDFLGKAITVRSCTGDPTTTIIDCQGTEADPHRGFWFHSGEDSTSILQSITVTGGGGVSYGGGILIGDPSNAGIVAAPIIRDCFITQNESPNGAGIAIQTIQTAAMIRNCDIENNTGSGLYLASYNGTEISNSRMVGNSSHGAIVVWGRWMSPKALLFGPGMIFESCEFSGNGQDGFYSEDTPEYINLVFTDCHFFSNSGWGLHTPAGEEVYVTVYSGSARQNTLGGIALLSHNGNDISNCIIENNLGPGIVLQITYINQVNGCIVRGNSGHGISFGGAKSVPSGDKQGEGLVGSCEISNNGGRGINFDRGIPHYTEITDCIIFANAEEGIRVNSPCLWEECQLDITYSTIVGNGLAGVSYCSDVPLNISNLLLAFNTGPGILCCGPEIPTLQCCDIYGNLGGDWSGCIAPQLGVNGNISEYPQFCGAADSDIPYTLNASSPCAPDSSDCGLIGAFDVNCNYQSGVEEGSGGLPAVSRLHPNYPNPFNPRTTISYDLPQSAQVNLRIYDLAGREVKTLVYGEIVKAGRKEIVWSGRDNSGRQVAAGVYFYKLDTGQFSDTKRMTLVK